MQLTRRSFIASLAGAFAMPRLALPAPPPQMDQPEVADELVVFHELRDYSVVAVTYRVVLIGRTAREALRRDPRLWSAVMVNRELARESNL